MQRGLPYRFALLCLLLAASSAFPSQKEPDFYTVIDQAEVIFAGRIKSVEPPNEAHSTFVITATVSEGIRGVRSDTDFQWSEWAGLWPVTGERYRVGKSVILLLHKPDNNGLTSVVGGKLGHFDISASNVIKFDEIQRRSVNRAMRLSPRGESGTVPNSVTTLEFSRALREMANRPPLF